MKRKQEKLYAEQKLRKKSRKMIYIVRKVGLEVLNEVYIQKGIIFSELRQARIEKKAFLFKIVLLGLVSTNLSDIFWAKAEILQKNTV